MANNTPRVRTSPALKVQRRMTRADSLSSMSEFGQIVPLEKQPAMREAAAKKAKRNPYQRLLDALQGK